MFNKKRIIKVISNKILDFKDIAKKTNTPHYKYKDLSSFLNILLKKGNIAFTNKKKYFVPKIEDTIIGIVRIHQKGFGFIDANEKTIFIPSYNLKGIFNKDELEVAIFKEPNSSLKYQGVIKKIINRNTQAFVGTVIKNDNGKFSIEPFNKNINGEFIFKDQFSLKIGNKVKVQITKYGSPNILEIINNVKNINNVDMDMLLAIEDSNISYKFNSKVKDEEIKIPKKINKNNAFNRKDLRNRLIITIDGEDTKDFDDAIEVQKIKNNYKLFVHIADVAHYVKENSFIDKEASLRSTSIYLPNYVIPMLPESLSNGICSLIPKEDRLTISLEININKKGQTIDTKIYPSIINSKYRLTYKEVNNYYEKKHSFNDKKLKEMLNYALELSKKIRKTKLTAGYVDFQIEESKIILDKKGKTKSILPIERYESEMMIEDFMVRANESIAKFIENKKLPFIYRIHAKPDSEKLANLKNIIQTLGINIKIKDNYSPLGFSKIIDEIKTSRFDNFIKIIMLRTMSKAIYSSDNIGHFGLASKSYTHFTSPIRRYPDLIVHRLLHEYIFKQNKNAKEHFQKKLPSIAQHSSDAEQKAVELERKIIDMKKAELYESKIGTAIDGIIVSIMNFGFFVEFKDKVNGLVHAKSLINDEYKLLESGCIFSLGNKKLKIGDKVRTKIVDVSKSDAKINLEFLKKI